jgi:hypothetical protein
VESKGKQVVGMGKISWAVVVVAMRSQGRVQKFETVPLALLRRARSMLIDQVDAVCDVVSGFCISRVVDSSCHHVAHH